MLTPNEDIESIDTTYIHWGYLNCCQTVSKGKKATREKWKTYWVELCGATIRFFEDKSLHIESHLFPPPSDQKCLLTENEVKAASLDIQNADIKIVSNETFARMFHSKSRKSVAPKVFRRHMFQLKSSHLQQCYVLQAPSHSAMLRWMSKIQESIDADEHDQKKSFPEERSKSVRLILRKRANTPDLLGVDETEDDTVSLLTIASDDREIHPSLKDLSHRLSNKREQIWQFEMQMLDFLGRGKGKFLRQEFKCEIKQDYLLIPTRIETFIPAGTKVTIFGQLPNKRWRCLIEKNELKEAFINTINALRGAKGSENDNICKASNSRGKINVKRDISTLEEMLRLIPDYPLIGCLPTSILDFHRKQPSARQKRYIVTVKSTPTIYPINISPSQTPPMERKANNIHTVSSADDLSDDSAKHSFQSLKDMDNNESDITPGHSESEDASDDDKEDIPELIKKVKLRDFGAGIIIRKKLRQKGISIIVGSSSSEGEEESDDDENKQ